MRVTALLQARPQEAAPTSVKTAHPLVSITMSRCTCAWRREWALTTAGSLLLVVFDCTARPLVFRHRGTRRVFLSHAVQADPGPLGPAHANAVILSRLVPPRSSILPLFLSLRDAGCELTHAAACDLQKHSTLPPEQDVPGEAQELHRPGAAWGFLRIHRRKAHGPAEGGLVCQGAGCDLVDKAKVAATTRQADAGAREQGKGK